MGRPDLDVVVAAIVDTRRSVSPERGVLVAVSGIDAAGKGYVASRIVDALTARRVRGVTINVDGWLNLPHVRFDPGNPAEHFYRHAIRFDQMFTELVLPLRDRRSLRIEADHATETATAYERRVYAFDDVDVIVLEGIFLFKLEFQSHYDLAVWIDCSIETSLERAVARGQEGLSPDETVAAFRRIYIPAQAIHIERDNPRAAAHATIDNDLESGGDVV